MNMRARAVAAGGFAFFAASLIVGLVLSLPDEALFEDAHRAMGPALREGGLIERGGARQFFFAWLAHKLVFGFGVALLYNWARPSLPGPGWKRGALLGLGTWPLVVATYLGQWSVFSFPLAIWAWWSLYGLISVLVSGAVMGAAVEKMAPS
jgi:hypothetical protein